VLSYEVVTAFFLEATFLGVLLFGRDKVPHGVHLLAAIMVAVGTFISTFWILAANSWMQTPAGVEMVDGVFRVTSWIEAIFNPSFPYRLVHMVLAAYLTTAFVVGGVGAWHLLRDARDRGARIMFSMAMWMALIVAPLQLIAGDLHGLNTLEHQPAKIAAMEGHYETHEGAPLILFGVPDDGAGEVHYELAIPHLGSWILTHEWDGRIRGLNSFPVDERPSAEIVFWTFRLMVLVGVAMMVLGLWSGIARWRDRLFTSKWLHRSAVAMAPSGFLAVLAGWITTEVGRQPWTVYGLLRTSESASPLDASAVGISLIAFVVVYFAVFGAGTYYSIKLMAKPPAAGMADDRWPIRAAGITPGPALGRGSRRDREEPR
jgi:cytochrome d ubiquinol oxidase subunit I